MIEPKCPRCGNIDKKYRKLHMKRKTKLGYTYSFRCLLCKKIFSIRLDGEYNQQIPRMRFSERFIKETVEFVTEHKIPALNVIKKYHKKGINISRQTIYNWIKKFKK